MSVVTIAACLPKKAGKLSGARIALGAKAANPVRARKAEAALFHLRLVQAKNEVTRGDAAHVAAVRDVADRTGAEAEAATRQANTAADLPALREGEARAAAVLQRLIAGRDALEREAARAKERIAELARRLAQLGEDCERERQLSADAEAALARLDAERETLAGEAAAGVERRSEVETRVGAAATTCGLSSNTRSDSTAHSLEDGNTRHSSRMAARISMPCY